MPRASVSGIERLPRQVAQDLADALKLFAHAIDLNLRRAQIAWQGASRFARVRWPAAGHLPPDNGEAHLLQPLRDGREVIADGAGAADQRVGPRKVLAVLKRGQHRADGAKGGVDAQLLRLLEQAVAALHQAGRPPGAVGIKRPQPRQRIGHDRHGAEVLHGADDLLALGAGGMEALVLGQQEIPEPQRGGGIVEAQMAQAQIAFEQNVAAQRPAVGGLAQAGAGELLVTGIPLVEGEFAGRGGHGEIRNPKARQEPESRDQWR